MDKTAPNNISTDITVKETIWKHLVFTTGLIPRPIRLQLSRILFASIAQGDSEQACRDLLTADIDLKWHINVAAIRYGKGIHPKHRLMNYHNFFTSHLKPGERVLDVGCGNGALSDSMCKAGAIVLGIDINEKSIEEAMQRFHSPRLTFIVGDISRVSIPCDVETIVLSNVLEHIENRLELLRHLIELLSPKRFLIRVPMIDRNWLVFFRKELGLRYFSDQTHFIEYTTDSFLQEMEQSGLIATSYEVKWGELYVEAIPLS